MQSRCRGAGVQNMCRGSEYLQGFRRGDCAGNCAEEVQIWRCSDRHAEVQVIVQAQWWFSRGADVTQGGAKQVYRQWCSYRGGAEVLMCRAGGPSNQ